MSNVIWQIAEGQGPIATAAIHDGHDLRAEVRETCALSDSERLREEDPGTGIMATIAGTQMVARRSRFEVDLNQPRDRAVHLSPKDARGLQVWKREPARHLVAQSLAEYDAFYAEAHRVLSELESRYGHFVVLDLHSYNHRRRGPDAAPDDPAMNPEVNIGTGTLDRRRWGLLVDRFAGDLTAFDFLGRHLDVRENVRSQGGHFSRWIHESFPETGCCLAVEFKKFFMNEWSGEFEPEEFEAASRALAGTIPGLRESLHKMGS